MPDKTTFEELCELLKKRNERYVSLKTEARSLINMFVHGLTARIGFPKERRMLNAGHSNLPFYVNAELVDENFCSLKDKDFSQIRLTKEFFLLFNLYIALEEQIGNGPSASYAFNCGIKPYSNARCKIFISQPDNPAQKMFECYPSQVAKDGEKPQIDFSAPIDHIAKSLRDMVSVDPFA